MAKLIITESTSSAPDSIEELEVDSFLDATMKILEDDMKTSNHDWTLKVQRKWLENGMEERNHRVAFIDGAETKAPVTFTYEYQV